jgi:1-aminocyclopropane-1-carboxylate deaminase
MTTSTPLTGGLANLADLPRFSLAQLPTPIHRLENFARHLGDIDLWVKRADLTGLVGGGNKTRKLEFLVGDAKARGFDMLVTVGAIQSNHTRQTAAAAAKAGMKCALLHNGWTRDGGPAYRNVGNILFSNLMGAELYLDETDRPIEDEGPLTDLVAHLADQGHKPYLIPGGASDHPLGSYGYAVCAAEIAAQQASLGFAFDTIVHCTGSSSTQSGLLAGLAAFDSETRVIGVPDDEETEIKKARVERLANAALEDLGASQRVASADVEIVVGDASPYGVSDANTFDAIGLLARTEGLIADPVYEGKAVRGLIDLARAGRFRPSSNVLLMHLGGTPATHAYANQYGEINLRPLPA